LIVSKKSFYTIYVSNERPVLGGVKDVNYLPIVVKLEHFSLIFLGIEALKMNAVIYSGTGGGEEYFEFNKIPTALQS